MLLRLYLSLFVLSSLIFVAYGRIHKLVIKNDIRKYIALSSFGFYKGGILDVKLHNFHAADAYTFGFTLDRTLNDAMNPYLESHQEHCLLEEPVNLASSPSVVFFTMNPEKMILQINCSAELQSLHIYKEASQVPVLRAKRDSFSDQTLFRNLREYSQPFSSERSKRSASEYGCTERKLPIVADNLGRYSTQFVIYIATEKEEGLYNLYFHSCPNYGTKIIPVDFSIEIEEKNKGNYLSAGEMPLPALYFMMSILFFLSGCFWVFILVKSKHTVFKIHYLMATLVYLKSLSLLFHAINYHFIQTKGEHVAAWAILYYITHLLKGSVLFITIVLIGTGWTFIKHILSEKDKKIFMIVIPLQVLANVALIILEESEEGDVEHKTWLDVFGLVDLLCCGSILFPVVWSIRHLQEASNTDGKAAINLRKLKLFRHFYIMIVCYIYFTRIIVYLLQIRRLLLHTRKSSDWGSHSLMMIRKYRNTYGLSSMQQETTDLVSFQYKWLDEMFKEMVTYVFFVLTGYKFRPESANPYFQVNTDDQDDDEVDIVISQCGVMEGLSKLSRATCEDGIDDKEALLPSKRESSHEYD